MPGLGYICYFQWFLLDQDLYYLIRIRKQPPTFGTGTDSDPGETIRIRQILVGETQHCLQHIVYRIRYRFCGNWYLDDMLDGLLGTVHIQPDYLTVQPIRLSHLKHIL